MDKESTMPMGQDTSDRTTAADAYKKYCLSKKVSTWYYKKKWEDNQMSFVGLTLHKNEVIAFADSKSSIPCEDGDFILDENRGPVDKIIQHENQIFVLAGTNTVPYETPNIRNCRCPIETAIKENTDQSAIRTLESAYQKIRAYGSGFWGIVNGYYAEWRNQKWEIAYFTMSADEFRIEQKIPNQIPDTYFSGDAIFVEYFRRHPILLHGSEEEIRKNIEDWVSKMEQTGIYQTVGLPIHTLTVQDKEIRDILS